MQNEKKIEITMITKQPFRIGGKEDPLRGQENPVAVVGEQVVVPGSSLKGALRAGIENYLIDTYYDKEKKVWKSGKEGLKPCIPSSEKQLSDDERGLIKNGKYRNVGCHYPCDPKPNKCGNNTHAICPACYLLGSNGLPGFVRVPFLTANISPSELYSSRVDRYSETVTQGTNRPYSLIPAEVTFKGTLIVVLSNDIKDWTLGNGRKLSENTGGDMWLQQDSWTQEKIINDLIIARLKKIEILGGHKSKGCGPVVISVAP